MTGHRSLLIAAHGFVREREDPHPASDHARRLRASTAFDEVTTGFANGDPAIEDSVRAVDEGRLVVVPLFVSDGYFVGQVVPERVEAALPAAVSVEYARPVGTHPRVTEVIERRALSAVDEAVESPENVAIALVGHGSEHSSANAEAIAAHASRIRARAPFAAVHEYFVEEQPTVERLPEEVSAPLVIVVPVFVANGTHVREDIPDQVGFAGRGGTVDGTKITAVAPVGTDPLVASVVHERALAAFEAVAAGSRDRPAVTAQQPTETGTHERRGTQ